MILAIHDGVDWTTTPDGPLLINISRMESFCLCVSAYVDAVIGGHTFLGATSDTSAESHSFTHGRFGAEVGVSTATRTARGACMASCWARTTDWQGAGSDVHACLAREIVGVVPAGRYP